MRIKFLVDHKVQQSDGKGPSYEKGRTYEFTGFSPETYAAKYVRVGIAEEVKEDARAVDAHRASEAAAAAEAARREAAEAAKLKARGAVVIPEKYADLGWKKLRPLATQLTDETVHSQADAIQAIEAELARRAAG